MKKHQYREKMWTPQKTWIVNGHASVHPNNAVKSSASTTPHLSCDCWGSGDHKA